MAALAAGGGILYQDSGDNELYWRTAGGTNVKLTSGTSLNVAAFVGGIGGDYASVSALLDFDDATDSYRLRQQVGAAVRQFAKASTSDLSLFEFKAVGVSPVPTNAVTLKSPAALGASYSVTWPAAVPGSTQLVQMSSAGVLTASNTVANAVTLSATLGAAAINTSGLITASAGVTLAANQTLTMSGSGSIAMSGTGTITCAGAVTATDHKFTTAVTFALHGSSGCVPSAAFPAYTVNDGTGAANWSFAAGNRLAIPANMIRTGDRITGFAIRADSTIGGTGTLDVKLWRSTSTAAPTQISTTLSHTNTTTDQTRTGITETVDAGESFHFTIRHSAGAGTPDFQNLFLTVDRP